MFKITFILFAVLFFNGCEKTSSNDVKKVHWDRDMCERCKMVLSDRNHAVQVTNPATSKVYMFDDIGCMILWFDEEHISWKDSAVIWVRDIDSGEWIDARKAFYDTSSLTPMSYGIGAHKDKSSIKKGEKVLTYDTIKPYIIKIENLLNKKSH